MNEHDEVSPNHRVYGVHPTMPPGGRDQLIYEGLDLALADAIANVAMGLGYTISFVKGGVRPFWVTASER
jgi:hypothetical protein